MFVESLATTVRFEVQLHQHAGDLLLYPTDAFRSLSADFWDEEKVVHIKIKFLTCREKHTTYGLELSRNLLRLTLGVGSRREVVKLLVFRHKRKCRDASNRTHLIHFGRWLFSDLAYNLLLMVFSPQDCDHWCEFCFLVMVAWVTSFIFSSLLCWKWTACQMRWMAGLDGKSCYLPCKQCCKDPCWPNA